MAFIDGAILGDRELKQRLEALPETIRNQALRQALRDEAKPVRDLARTKAPIDRGRLKQSIKIRARKARRRGVIGINIQTGTREELGIEASAPGYYPAAIEFGFRHARSGEHVPAQSYMRAALKARESGMLTRLQQNMRKAIDTVVARRLRVIARRNAA